MQHNSEKNKANFKFTTNLFIFFREYCNCTSVHGVRYFGEKRTIFEKLWWMIVFTSCILSCIYMVYFAYNKWEESPIIVSFASKAIPIHEILFPAITVCPAAKVAKKKFNLTDVVYKMLTGGKNMSKTEYIGYNNMRLLYKECNLLASIDLILLKSADNDASENISNFLHRNRPQFPVFLCKHESEWINFCKQAFIPILTEEGICYSYNILDRKNIFRNNVVFFKNYHVHINSTTKWSKDYGYDNNADVNTYPKKALFTGIRNALSLTLGTLKEDKEYSCESGLQGFKLLVHDPGSLPTPGQRYLTVPLDQAVTGVIVPSMIKTSDRVKKYSLKRRRCFFQEDRYLKYFKIYNAANCQLECQTNYTLKQCGCVHFYMPRNNDTAVCTHKNLNCTLKGLFELQLKELRTRLSKSEKPESNDNCNCLPLCSDVSYSVELSQNDWEWYKDIYIKENDVLFTDRHHLSSLQLYFKTDNFIPSVRNEIYGLTDFIANIGGLLGLFTGFSIISLLEIIYFLTIRIICNRMLYKQWSGHNAYD